eukprot:TRINITY_DN1291_c7_g1_i1.p1 TRINITY_DN1291_c7_g1~~TRINITY_DN1291_c7_g1_i1.p1  ORF type:complete len:287 (-),score=92.39 TRINITY_DN1291_c7_g1_i1:366-1226(-)
MATSLVVISLKITNVEVESIKSDNVNSMVINNVNLDDLLGEINNVKDKKFSTVISVGNSDVHKNSEFLKVINQVLSADGKLVVKEPINQNENQEQIRTQDEIKNNFIFSGFQYEDVSETSEYGYNIAKFTFKKPNWEVGAASKLKKKKKPSNNSFSPVVIDLNDDTIEVLKKPEPNFNEATVWTINPDDDDDELEDEDALLEESDLINPKFNSNNINDDDCERAPGKNSACKNCTCGRANFTPKQLEETPKSNCGNCYLGDAFRCSTCPHLGKPAFKPGEIVKLDL